MANRYIFHSRISEAKFRPILRLFALDLNAVQIAALTDLSRVSINRHLAALRRRMAACCEQAAPMSGEIEVDESCFGARRIKGKRGPADTGSTIDSDGWGGYDGLVDMGYRRHLKVVHGHGEWARGAAHINGIEGFWGFAKSRLAKFRGMSKHTFYLHLKECEFRFNHRHDEVYEILLESCRKRPSYLDSA
ncbi:MAG: transposase [Gammaproteobacteria bacterium]|nr:transposase [Gammaproteobacteria bacterium]